MVQWISSSFGIEPQQDYNQSGCKMRFNAGSLVVEEKEQIIVVNFAFDGPHTGIGQWHENSMIRSARSGFRPKKVINRLFKENWDDNEN